MISSAFMSTSTILVYQDLNFFAVFLKDFYLSILLYLHLISHITFIFLTDWLCFNLPSFVAFDHLLSHVFSQNLCKK